MNFKEQVIGTLHLLNHPFYRDWMEGKITQLTLQDYAKQYLKHIEYFPRYLSGLHFNCENPQIRREILENLNDEEGLSNGKPHPELWMQFAEGMGVSKEEALSTIPRPAIQNVISTFIAAVQKSTASGLGALMAYESQIPEIAESKIKGLKEQYGITKTEILEFFEVHRSADIYHAQALDRIFANLTLAEQNEAIASGKAIAQALWDFLTEVHNLQLNAA